MTTVRALRRAYVASGVRALLPMRAKQAGRSAWVRLARSLGYPISSPRLPRPPLERRRLRMRLSHALLACDLNPRYLESWPLVRRAWEEVAGLEPLLVLVADENDAPPELLRDSRVRLFPPVPGIHSALQAQCIRLLYPALLETKGAVVISDVELVPMQPSYFHDPVAAVDERFFVAYRGDVFLHRREMPIAYNAARPETWGDVFGVRSLADVTERLRAWGAGVDYAGVRGGEGWFSDQLVLYERLTEWADAGTRLWVLDDQYTGYCRLERGLIEGVAEVPEWCRRGVLERRYVDFNSPIPHGAFAAVNDAVLDLALESLGRSPLKTAAAG